MKYIFLSIFLILSIVTATSQEKKLEKVDRLFEQFQYKKALNKYLKLEKDNTSLFHVKNRIAACYKNLNNLYKAEQWYKEVLEFPDVTPDTYFHLGQVLLKLGKQQEGAEYIQTYYNKKNINDLKSITYDYSHLLDFLSKKNNNYIITGLPINTEYSEFGPTINNSTLYYCSNKPTNSIINRNDLKTQSNFYNIYEAKIISDTTFENAVISNPAFNSKYNDGPICFSKTNKLAFITRNDPKSNNTKSQLDIVICKFENKNWSDNIYHLTTKDKSYSIAHPFITNDLSRLYYVSNQPGGYGGMDIYYSEFKNGFLSSPVNLGPEINSPGNEATPFIAEDSTLFFASDGHPGLGGMDIFFAPIKEEKYMKAFNLGSPVNSKDDDMSLFLFNNGKSGYFSSSRIEGKGQDDIYMVSIKKPLTYINVVGTTIGEDKFPLKGSLVTIYDSNKEKFNEVTTNDSGEFSIYLPNTENFTIEFKRRYYEIKRQEITLKNVTEKTVQLPITLKKQ